MRRLVVLAPVLALLLTGCGGGGTSGDEAAYLAALHTKQSHGSFSKLGYGRAVCSDLRKAKHPNRQSLMIETLAVTNSDKTWSVVDAGRLGNAAVRYLCPQFKALRNPNFG